MGFCSRVDHARIVVAIYDHGGTSCYVSADPSSRFPAVRREEEVDRMVFMLGLVAEVGIDAGTDGGGAVCEFMLDKDMSFQFQATRPVEEGGL